MATREAFFERAHEVEHVYLGYSDLQLRTERISEVDAAQVDISGRVSANVILKNPLIAAAMNSVSEDKMGIATGLNGAGAILHHCNTPEEQKKMVRTVKTYLNGVITEPVVAREDQTLAEVLQVLDKADNDFRTIPVIDENGRCTGLMDDTTFSIFGPDAETVKIGEAMHPLGEFVTADNGTTPEDVYKLMREKRAPSVVLLDTDRRVGGLCLKGGILREVNSNPDEYSVDQNGRLITFASVPTIPDEALERIRIMRKYLDVVFIDTSHGEHKYALETLKAIKENTDIDVIAGNISTEQAAIQIARLEPDGISVGQGPGQICVSSDRLGFGTPQASAVYEVAKGARSVNPDIAIIADGGISQSADSVKALALGATVIKAGGLFAGTDETPVPILTDKSGVKYKEYWGMGSERAQRNFAAARARYGNFGAPKKIIFVEGFEKQVPLKGPVADVIEEHVMGMKISMAAQGAHNAADLFENARFMRGANTKK